MLKRATIIVLGIFLFSLAANINVVMIKAEKLQAENSPQIEEQVRQIFDELEKAINIRIDCAKEYKVVVGELIGLGKTHKDKLIVDQQQKINDYAVDIAAAEMFLRMLESKINKFVENKEKFIDKFINENEATEEALGILKKKIAEDNTRTAESIKNEDLDPAKKFLQEIKEKIKSLEEKI